MLKEKNRLYTKANLPQASKKLNKKTKKSQKSMLASRLLLPDKAKPLMKQIQDCITKVTLVLAPVYQQAKAYWSSLKKSQMKMKNKALRKIGKSKLNRTSRKRSKYIKIN